MLTLAELILFDVTFHSLKIKIKNLKPCWTPVNKLDRLASLDGCNGCIDVFGHNISTVEQADGHVLASTRVTFHHLIVGFKALLGDVIHSGRFMQCLLIIK